jgi:putative oxidoreductase
MIRLLRDHHHRYVDGALLLLRLCAGPFMLTHGIPKLMRFFGDDPVRFSDPIGLGMISSLLLAVFAEVICSALITLGLVTRWAALPLIVTMSVAAFVVHGGDEFGSMEMALLYLLIYVFILIAGPGKYSMDYLFFARK